MSNDPDRNSKGQFVKGNSYLANTTPERRHQMRVNGGKKAGETHRRRRKIRTALEDILAAPLIDTDEKMAAIAKLYGIENPQQADALALSMVLKAIEGDVEAAKFTRDTTGEKPTTGVEIGNLDDKPFESINLSELSDEELQRMAFTRQSDEGENADSKAE